MLEKIIHFIKYNNFTVFIILAVFLLSTGVFAQTEAGQELIGEKETRTEGVDNTLLLGADLDNFNMNYKIEKIEEDDEYYYATYTFLDLAEKNNAWQYEMREKVKKISKNFNGDLGEYLAGELSEEYAVAIKKLKEKRAEAENSGEKTRVEITEYSGLIGQTLFLAGKIFPDYESIKKTEIPSPSSAEYLTSLRKAGGSEDSDLLADDLAEIYRDYAAKNDPDADDVFGSLDNCPDVFNPDQSDSDSDGAGDACDSEESGTADADAGAEEQPAAPIEEKIASSSAEKITDDIQDEVLPDEETTVGGGINGESYDSVEIVELPAEEAE